MSMIGNILRLCSFMMLAVQFCTVSAQESSTELLAIQDSYPEDFTAEECCGKTYVNGEIRPTDLTAMNISKCMGQYGYRVDLHAYTYQGYWNMDYVYTSINGTYHCDETFERMHVSRLIDECIGLDYQISYATRQGQIPLNYRRAQTWLEGVKESGDRRKAEAAKYGDNSQNVTQQLAAESSIANAGLRLQSLK